MRNNKSSLPGLRLPTVPWTSVIASPVRCRHGHGLEYFSSSFPFGQQMPQATSLIPYQMCTWTIHWTVINNALGPGRYVYVYMQDLYCNKIWTKCVPYSSKVLWFKNCMNLQISVKSTNTSLVPRPLPSFPLLARWGRGNKAKQTLQASSLIPTRRLPGRYTGQLSITLLWG